MDNFAKGKLGEKLAAIFLKNKQYQLMDRNVYISRFGELDLVYLDNRSMVFVEVKTRTNTSFGSPIESLDSRKQRQLVKLAQLYLFRAGMSYTTPVRFDIITVQVDKHVFTCEIKHVKDAVVL